MLNAVSACKISSSTLFSQYQLVTQNYLRDGNAFPPLLYFYNEVGVIPYNISPTVIGDILCGNFFEVFLAFLVIFLYLKFTLFLSKLAFGISSGVHKYHLFMLIMLMTSTSFDILKFEIIYWLLAILLHHKLYDKKSIRLGM
jgi:hypothetical protein